MSIWFSSGAFNSTNTSGVLTEASQNGVQGIELSSGLKCSQDEMHLIRAAHKSGQQRFLVHNYFPAPATPFVLNIATLDDDVLFKSNEMAKFAIRLAHDVSAPFYSVHAGFAARLSPAQLGKPRQQANSLSVSDINQTKAYEAMIRNVRGLADFASTLGVGLLIENNVISPLYLERMPVNPLLLTEGHEICRFFEDLERPNVGLLLDVAHAKVSATALGLNVNNFVDQVAPHVRCLHLSDNDGRTDSNQPLNEDSWFIPRLREFRHCELVIEAYRLQPQVIKAQLELVHRIIQ